MMNMPTLLLLAKAVQQKLDEIARASGLHREQILLLIELEQARAERAGKRRFSDLVVASMNPPTRTSQHLRALLNAGLCEKEVGRLSVGEGSGSYALYSITPSGRALLRRIGSSLREIEAMLSPGAYSFKPQAPAVWMGACLQRCRAAWEI